MKKFSLKAAAPLILSLAVFFPLISDAQWAPPTQAPTAGNVSAPLNVSNIAQTKSGGLLLNTGGAANGLIIQFGNMGLGTTSPSAKIAITALGTGTGRAFALANSSNVEKVTILDNGNVNVSGDVSATRLCLGGVCQSSWASSGGQWANSGFGLNYTAGNVSVGTTISNATLTVAGGMQLGTDNGTCNAAKAGTIRWTGILQVCFNGSWVNLETPSYCKPQAGCGSTAPGDWCVTYDVPSVRYGTSCPTPRWSSCTNNSFTPAPYTYSSCTVANPIYGCDDPNAKNYCAPGACDIYWQGYCQYPYTGCKYDTEACNYDPAADFDDQSLCEYSWNDERDGCRDEEE